MNIAELLAFILNLPLPIPTAGAKNVPLPPGFSIEVFRIDIDTPEARTSGRR
jgi:hypothetical protein